MKYKIGFALIGVVILVLGINTYNNYETNSRFNFKKDDIKEVWVFKGHHGLSYNYNIDENILKNISKELINSKRTKASSEKQQIISPQPMRIYIVSDSPNGGSSGNTAIMERDSKSVYVVSNKIGGRSKILIMESSYLSDYLKRLEIELDK